MPIDTTRPVELLDGTLLTNVTSYGHDLFKADLPEGYSAEHGSPGTDRGRLFRVSDGSHYFGEAMTARNVECERPDIPEREPERLGFDPMQPLELDDGSAVQIARYVAHSSDDMHWLVQTPDGDANGERFGRGCTFYVDLQGRYSGQIEYASINNVDPNASEALRKARSDWRRLADGLKPDFVSHDWYAPLSDLHFAMLVERDEVAMVSFFESERKLEAERRTEMRVGRYVRRFCGGKLKDEDVERVAAASDVKLRGNRVKITQDADEIESVYRYGPSSCMSGGTCDFDTDGIHPSRVYAGPDLALAYIGDMEDASSRCVVWPDKKRYGRIYGDETRMRSMLQQMGFEHGSMKGARVRLIECDYGIVMPYVDNINGAKIDRGAGVCILGEGWDVETGNTNGLGGQDDRVECDHCGDMVNETFAVSSSRYSAEEWCDNCRADGATYCEYASEYVRDDCMVDVQTARGSDSCAEWMLDDCDFARVEAGDHEDEYWPTDMTGENADGEIVHIDDLPEPSEDAKPTVPRATVEEAEAAGQMALPLEAEGEFWLMYHDTDVIGSVPQPCILRGGTEETYVRGGTYDECEARRAHLSAQFRRVRYWIEPVGFAVEYDGRFYPATIEEIDRTDPAAPLRIGTADGAVSGCWYDRTGQACFVHDGRRVHNIPADVLARIPVADDVPFTLADAA